MFLPRPPINRGRRVPFRGRRRHRRRLLEESDFEEEIKKINEKMQHLDLDNSEIQSHVVMPEHPKSVFLHPAVVVSQKLKHACKQGGVNTKESWF